MRITLFSTFCLLALTACNPSYMPAGYKYHHEDYKSPPGEEPLVKTDAASATNPSQAEIYDDTAINP
jgi:hypothetical protein